jgi:hypothetical protein
MKSVRANRGKLERRRAKVRANKRSLWPEDSLRDPNSIRSAELTEVRLPKERRTLFRQLWVAYEKQQSLETFLRLACEFPGVEIRVPPLFHDPFFLNPEMAKYGINPDLISTFGDDIVVSIDKLSLRLIELLVDRTKLPKRQDAITDPLVNCLIVIMLDNLSYFGLDLPAPFLLLIRDRLCGPAPDHRQAYKSSKLRDLAIRVVAAETNKMSVRALAASIGISKTTASRWLGEADFHREVEERRQELPIAELLGDAVSRAWLHSMPPFRDPQPSDEKEFLEFVQARLDEAQDAEALCAAWAQHVQPVQSKLFSWDRSRCSYMFQLRLQQIKNSDDFK